MKPQQKPIQHSKHQKFPSSSTPRSPTPPTNWPTRRPRSPPALVQSLQKNVLHLLFEAKVLDRGGRSLEDLWRETRGRRHIGDAPWENHGSNGKKPWEPLPNWKIGKKRRKKLGEKTHRCKLALGVLKKNTGMCPKSRSQPVLEPVVSHHQAQGSREELAAGLILRFKPMVFFPDLTLW